MVLTRELVQALLRAPGDSGAPDLADVLEDCLSAVVDAVPSCLAVSLDLVQAGHPFSLTARTTEATTQAVGTSLALHLPTPGDVVLVLYAADAGSLVRPRDDCMALMSLAPGSALLDTRLELPLDAEVATGFEEALDELSDVNRALGVLLDRGLLPDEGRVHLARHADRHGTSLAVAARALLSGLPRPELGAG